MSIPPPVRVLVTGATGMLGSHAVEALLDAGHRVVAFVRDPGKAARVLDPARVEVAVGGIGDLTSVDRALQGCDAVVHCAAVVAVDSVNDPRTLIATNVTGARNVIGRALDQGIERVVHVSSIAPLFRRDGAPITEDSGLQRSTRAYSQSKMEADLYVRGLQEAGRPVKILYPGAIIGPNDPGLTESMRAVKIFSRTFLPVTTSGIQYVDVRDLATAIVRMVEDDPAPARYIAAGHFLTWDALAELLAEVTARQPPAHRVPAWAFQLAGWLADAIRWLTPIDLPLSAESAAYVTRWTPIESSQDFERLGIRFRPIEETMTDTVQWLREAGHL